MLQGKRGELAQQFSTQQMDAIERYMRSVQSPAPEHFLVTNGLAQAVGTGYQVLSLDTTLINEGSRWQPTGRVLVLPAGSVWDLRLYVTTDTAIPGTQRNELFLAEASGAIGTGARLVDFWYQDRPAGLASPAMGNARIFAPLANVALRPIVRFSGATVVNTIPGQGFTALSGVRIA